MDWKITWKYIDPANEQEYITCEVLKECSLKDVMLWCVINVSEDYIHEVSIVDYSA